MKLLIFIFMFFSFSSFAQSEDYIEIELFKNNKKLKDNFKTFLISGDTVITLDKPFIKKSDINKFSIRICYGKHGLLIPNRDDKIEYLKVYLDKKSYRTLNETKFSLRNPFKKFYFVDLGLDIMLRIGRSNKKHCGAMKNN